MDDAFDAGDGGPHRRALRVRRGAKALAVSSGRVLLTRERHADGRAFWSLPGGGVHVDESVAAGLRRELSEELRCLSRVRDQVGTYGYRHTSRPNTITIYTVCACELLSEPNPAEAEGIEAYRWVEPTDPPATTLGPVRRVLHAHGPAAGSSGAPTAQAGATGSPD